MFAILSLSTRDAQLNGSQAATNPEALKSRIALVRGRPSTLNPANVSPFRSSILQLRLLPLSLEQFFEDFRPRLSVCGRQARPWQSSSSSWPMSVAACRSRCRPRPRPRSCARALPTPATTSFLSARAAASACGRRKVKLEPFLIFNQQFLTLIRAGLPILGSLQMLGKIQKNAAFCRPVGRRRHPREDAARRFRRPSKRRAASR